MWANFIMSCHQLKLILGSEVIQALLLYLPYFMFLFDLGFRLAAGLFVALCPARWQMFMTSERFILFFIFFIDLVNLNEVCLVCKSFLELRIERKCVI